MRVVFTYFLLFFLTGGCVDPANIKVPSASDYLVVDGSITDEPGPYVVTLAHAISLNEKETNAVPETGAKISIVDDTGAEQVLSEFTAGTYRTINPGFMGQAGKKYYVKIKTKDGREFESAPETLQPVGSLDSLYYEFEYHTEYINNKSVAANRFRIYVNATGLNNTDNLIRWKWNGTYEVENFPQYAHVSGGNTFCLPRPCIGICTPLPCSGVTSFVDDGVCVFPRFAPCTCCNCWVRESAQTPVVSDDQLVVNNRFNKVFVGTIPVNRRAFYNKYHVEVEQMSLSPVAYNFWRIITQQKTQASSIFQPVNGKARGNISPTNNSSEIIGLFSASSVKRKSIFLLREFVPYKLAPIDTVTGSCLDIRNAVNIKPAFWQ